MNFIRPLSRPTVAPSRGRGLKRHRMRCFTGGLRRPLTGARIETRLWDLAEAMVRVAPSRGRGLKPRHDAGGGDAVEVAPSRGRGLKRAHRMTGIDVQRVAPSRGRGLKHQYPRPRIRSLRRPLTGARIETTVAAPYWLRDERRPLTGARIETGL